MGKKGFQGAVPPTMRRMSRPQPPRSVSLLEFLLLGGGRKGGEPRHPQPHPQSPDAGAAPGDAASQTRRLDAPDRGVAQRAPRSPGASYVRRLSSQQSPNNRDDRPAWRCNKLVVVVQ